jgi:Ion channel
MPRKVREVIAQSWESQANLSLFLALLVLLVFVVPSLGLERADERLYSEFASSVLLISGVTIAWRRRVVFLLASSIGVVTIIVRWAALPTLTSTTLSIWPHLLTIATILMLLYILLSQVFAPGPVTPARIQGAIAVYLLFGIGWANAYHIVASKIPGSFTLPGHDLSSVNEWFYFSYSTLTTVGFGDIVPAHPIARSLSVAEVLTGQLYLAVLIGRLVGMQISPGASPTDNGST